MCHVIYSVNRKRSVILSSSCAIFRDVTYAVLIKELWKRSGLSVKDYAEQLNYSTAHVSHVLNDAQPGGLKMLLACLDHAGLDIQDCLFLPDPDASVTAHKRHASSARQLFALLDLKPPTSEVIKDAVEAWYERYVGQNGGNSGR